MVKKIIIDCKNLLQKEQAHLYLAQMLDFPDYYGHNLDALFDCLTELGKCTITFKNENILYQADCYGVKVLKVFEEAAQAHPGLKLEVQETEVREM